jgi:hypothetical protein
MMYQDIFEKLKSGTFKPIDDFQKGIAKRVKQHTETPKVDIIFEEEIDGLYVTAYTDELMMYALASIRKGRK